jgi:transcriptional regulator
MYTPRHFEETRLDVMHALIAANPFGALVRVGPNGMDADHLPFEIAPPSDEAPKGTLRAHVARSNPVWREAGAEVLVMFVSSSATVSPASFEQKASTGKLLPSWNYAVVHAHGRLRVLDDPACVRSLVERLRDRHETGRIDPWNVADAPDDYIDTILKAIVGLEIPIGKIEGRRK